MKLHGIVIVFLVFMVGESFSKVADVEKIEFCSQLKCRHEDAPEQVCGMRAEGEGFRLKLFQDECELLKYGCSVDEEDGAIDLKFGVGCYFGLFPRHGNLRQYQVVCGIPIPQKITADILSVFGLILMVSMKNMIIEDQEGSSDEQQTAYGIINKDYCDRSFETNYNETADYTKNESQRWENIESRKFENTIFNNITDTCGITCDNSEKKEVCGIRKDGNGYRVRLFQNYCDLIKHNCENYLDFIKTDLFICKTDLKNKKEDNNKNNNVSTKDILNNHIKNKLEDSKYAVDDFGKANTPDYKDKNEVKKDKVKNLVVVNSKIFGQYDNINDSIDTFFAVSHVFDLPLTEVKFNTRRKWIKSAGPVKIFVPWSIKPKIILNDTFHKPTLSTCFHKCPIKCPDTYVPVCGTPAISSLEPTLIFQNHCFMDVAQCKIYWENKSSTSADAKYVETSFLFCLGEEMNSVYRFLPAIRTLQHMGRLKKKGKYRNIIKNFRFVSKFRAGRPKFMG